MATRPADLIVVDQFILNSDTTLAKLLAAIDSCSFGFFAPARGAARVFRRERLKAIGRSCSDCPPTGRTGEGRVSRSRCFLSP